MIDNLSVAFHTFAKRILTSLSFDKILLPRYVNWSTNFRDLPFKMEIALFLLKTYLLLALVYVVWDSAGNDVLARSAMLSPYSAYHIFCRTASTSFLF